MSGRGFTPDMLECPWLQLVEWSAAWRDPANRVRVYAEIDGALNCATAADWIVEAIELFAIVEDAVCESSATRIGDAVGAHFRADCLIGHWAKVPPVLRRGALGEG